MFCCANALPYASSLLLLASFTCVLASPAHMYMPHLFTHCLPTIICVMLILVLFSLCIFSYFCGMLHFFVIHMG